MIPNWNLISNIYPINKTTKILFTNVIDIHSIYKSHLINSTYLATPRTRLEERIARRGDRLKSKRKEKKRRMRTKKKIFRGSESTYFRMTSNGTFSKGTVALAVRGEAGWGWEAGWRAKKRKGEEARTRKEKKAGRQVGKSDESSWLVACGEVDGGTVVRCKVNGLEPSRIYSGARDLAVTWPFPRSIPKRLYRFDRVSSKEKLSPCCSPWQSEKHSWGK